MKTKIIFHNIKRSYVQLKNMQKEKPHAILLKACFLTMWLQSNAAASITKHPIFHFFPDKNEKYNVHRSTFEKNNVVTLKHYIFIQLVFASWIIWIYDSVKFKPLWPSHRRISFSSCPYLHFWDTFLEAFCIFPLFAFPFPNMNWYIQKSPHSWWNTSGKCWTRTQIFQARKLYQCGTRGEDSRRGTLCKEAWW